MAAMSLASLLVLQLHVLIFTQSHLYLEKLWGRNHELLYVGCATVMYLLLDQLPPFRQPRKTARITQRILIS